jgi:hypothetical protein
MSRKQKIIWDHTQYTALFIREMIINHEAGVPGKTAKKNTGVCKNTSFQKAVLEFSGLAFEFSLHVHHLLCQAQPGLKMRKSISQICGCHFTLALRTNHQWLLADLQGFTESTPTRSCVQK